MLRDRTPAFNKSEFSDPQRNSTNIVLIYYNKLVTTIIKAALLVWLHDINSDNWKYLQISFYKIYIIKCYVFVLFYTVWILRYLCWTDFYQNHFFLSLFECRLNISSKLVKNHEIIISGIDQVNNQPSW